MKVLFFSKSKEINDFYVMCNMFYVVLLIVFFGFVFEHYVLNYLYDIVAPVVPGVDSSSGSTIHVSKAKSFWSLSWFLFPFLSLWFVFLSFLVRTKLVLKVREFFYLVVLFSCIFAACYFGIELDEDDLSRLLSRFYYNSLIGVYMIGGSCWGTIYFSLFFLLRVVLSWTKWTR